MSSSTSSSNYNYYSSSTTVLSSKASSSSSSSSSPSSSLTHPRAAVAVTLQFTKTKSQTTSSTTKQQDSSMNKNTTMEDDDDNTANNIKDENDPNYSTNYYLLIQRGKEPNKGMWSLPGGSIELGETTLCSAQRELFEEIKFIDYQLIPQQQQDDDDDRNQNNEKEKQSKKNGGIAQITWYPQPFITSDAIVFDNNDKVTTTAAENYNTRKVLFHYLIAQCFAQFNILHSDPNDNNIDSKTNNNYNNEPSDYDRLLLLLPKVLPDDDADDAKWFTLEEIKQMAATTTTTSTEPLSISPGVDTVIERAELLQSKGLLNTQVLTTKNTTRQIK